MKHAKLKRILGGLGILLVVLVLGYAAIRPFHLSWGATADEVSRPLPGDLAGVRWTRAITIDAAPDKIWPWLVQWGQGRGGWYSYDWLENLLGFDIHTAGSILPQYQTLALGDKMCMAAGFCPLSAAVIEPNRVLAWQAQDDQGKPDWTFILALVPIDGAHTRLLVRESFDPAWLPPAASIAFEIPDAVMEVKAINTVKDRVEGVPASGLTTASEIVVWLAALVIGLVAGVLFVRRADGQLLLAVGLVSVLVLLVLTFLFPPLWLRGVLDLGLFAALVWSLRRRPGSILNQVPVTQSPSRTAF